LSPGQKLVCINVDQTVEFVVMYKHVVFLFTGEIRNATCRGHI